MAAHYRQREINTFGSLLHVAGVLMSLALTVVVAWAAVAPIDGRSAQHEAKAARLDRLLAGAARTRANHRRLEAELNTVRGRKAELRRRITDGAREGEFLRQVTEAADQVDLRLREFRPGQISRNGRYGTMRIDLICEGTYASICRFLDRLEALPRLATVNRIEITAPLHGGVYPFIVTLDIYFAADGPVATTPKLKEAQDA